MYIFLLVLGGGQDKLAWTACPPPPPGVKITRVGQDIPGQLVPWGARQPRSACPPGGKLSRGQDKLGHRLAIKEESKVASRDWVNQQA